MTILGNMTGLKKAWRRAWPTSQDVMGPVNLANMAASFSVVFSASECGMGFEHGI